MALIDVVKYEVDDEEFIYKFPSENLKIGTQLVVYPSQTAYFVKGGQICDEFQSGTYTIKTDNIPILTRLINIPFGGNTPFKAEVWFVNQISSLNLKWGTPLPIQLEDPKYGIIVPVRAFGQYGIRIAKPRVFMETLLGNMTSFDRNKINDYFKGKMIAQLSSLITQKMVLDKVSVLEINAHLVTMSDFLKDQLSIFFDQFGIGLIDFSLMSINVPEDDPSLKRLKDAVDKAAQLRIFGKDVYQMDRSFDVMEKAVSNEGSANDFTNMGMGLGMGVTMGGKLGNIMGQNINTNIVPPPIPQGSTYYVAINGQQIGPCDVNTIVQYINSGQINSETLVWKQNMPTWAKISTLPEFVSHFQNFPPPIPPTL